jgi:hypothetical protein
MIGLEVPRDTQTLVDEVIGRGSVRDALADFGTAHRAYVLGEHAADALGELVFLSMEQPWIGSGDRHVGSAGRSTSNLHTALQQANQSLGVARDRIGENEKARFLRVQQAVDTVLFPGREPDSARQDEDRLSHFVRAGIVTALSTERSAGYTPQRMDTELVLQDRVAVKAARVLSGLRTIDAVLGDGRPIAIAHINSTMTIDSVFFTHPNTSIPFAHELGRTDSRSVFVDAKNASGGSGGLTWLGTHSTRPEGPRAYSGVRECDKLSIPLTSLVSPVVRVSYGDLLSDDSEKLHILEGTNESTPKVVIVDELEGQQDDDWPYRMWTMAAHRTVYARIGRIARIA